MGNRPFASCDPFPKETGCAVLTNKARKKNSGVWKPPAEKRDWESCGKFMNSFYSLRLCSTWSRNIAFLKRTKTNFTWRESMPKNVISSLQNFLRALCMKYLWLYYILLHFVLNLKTRTQLFVRPCHDHFHLTTAPRNSEEGKRGGGKKDGQWWFQESRSKSSRTLLSGRGGQPVAGRERGGSKRHRRVKKERRENICVLRNKAVSKVKFWGSKCRERLSQGSAAATGAFKQTEQERYKLKCY